MAKVKLKPGVKPFTGIYCGCRHHVTNSGEQRMHFTSIPSEDDIIDNPAARAQRIIALCVYDIQERMHSMPQAIRQYRAIRARVQRDYKRYYTIELDNNKLRQLIVRAYFQDKRRRPSRQQQPLELPLHPP